MARDREREKERKKKSDESPRRKRIRHWWCRTGKPQCRKPRGQKERGGDEVAKGRKLKLKSKSKKRLFPVGKRGGSPHVTGVWTRRGKEEISAAGNMNSILYKVQSTPYTK